MDFIYTTAVKLIVIISGDGKPKIFTLQRALLNVLGFNWWKGGMNVPLPSFLKHKIYQIFSISLMLYSCILTIKASAEMEITSGFQYTIKMNGIILTMPFLVSVLKMFYLTYMKDDLVYLFETCEKLGDLDVNKDPISFGIKSCFMYTELLLMNAGTWTLYFTLVYHEIPYATDYPWSQDNLIGWFSALGTDFFCGVHACCVNALLDTIFPMAVASMAGNLEKLMNNLNKIGRGHHQDRVIMYECVELHNKLLRIRDVIRKCFDEVFVAQSMYTVLHACVLIFAVAKAQDKFGVMMSSFPLLLCSYAQLWMYCSFGQTMTDKFDQLTFASYNNRWYRCNISTKKALILFTEACKKPVSLITFGTISASVSNFLHKIQDSVSYYLILKTVTAGSEPS